MITRNEYSDSAESLQSRRLAAPLSQHMEPLATVNPAEPAGVDIQPGWRLGTILVPTDFSPCSLAAVARAAEMARHYDATLTILHVIDSNPPSAHTHLGSAEDLMQQLRATGLAELRRLAVSLAQQQTKAQTRIIEGLPAEAIIENSAGFDLLVIGEPCSKSPWNLFSRHTARRVLEEAACPVLVVHEPTDRVCPPLLGRGHHGPRGNLPYVDVPAVSGGLGIKT